MRIADRIGRLSTSQTLALVAKTQRLRSEGRDIISFGAGQPDFDTPAHIREAAAHAIGAGHTRYTPVAGILPLRRAIADIYSEQWGLSYDADDVLVTCGAKHALFGALMSLVNDGDRVVVPSPYWVSYPEMVKAAGGEPVIVPCGEETGFKLTPGALREAGRGARVVILNSVSNPTGAVLSPDEQRALAEVCAELDLAVLSDEIYERLVYGEERFVPFATLPGAAERTVTISGVSKTFAMTGWRIGYAAGPSDVIAAMRKLQGQSTSNACSVSQHAALAALTGDQAEIEHMRQEFAQRRDRMVALLRDIPDVHVTTPGGAFYVFPRMDAFYGRREDVTDSVSLCDALLDEAGVGLVPGSAFGSDPHARLSYACSMDEIESGMSRLREFLASLGA